MSESNAKDELRNVGAHAKEALRATLLAARSALDLAIRKLDEDPDAPDTADATASPQSEPADSDSP